MKTINICLKCTVLFVTLLFLVISKNAVSQVTESSDTLKVAKPDPVKTTATDTIKSTTAEGEQVKTKDKKGKKNEIILYSGVNFTQLGSSDSYESETGTGYQLGAYYKQGRLFYWQVGARFASAKIGYKSAGSADTTDFVDVPVSSVDLPVTAGVNFTSFMNRVLSVRLFVSAVPSFTLNVGDNPFGFRKEDVNSFIFNGQAGLGINVAFFVVEAGYNYGFNELIIKYPDSKPGQVFVNLGFRF